MLAVLSGLLGFLSGNVYITVIAACAVLSLAYWLAWPRKSQRIKSVLIVAGFASALGAAVALPYVNAGYLRVAGVHQTAIVERVTPFRVLSLGRHVRPIENIRYDLRVVDEDGSTWTTYVHRRAGPLGPYLLDGARAASGDPVTIAYVEGQRANVTLVTETSDAVWKARARSIETGWSISPPDDNWVSHKISRDQIDAFLDEFADVADAETKARLVAMREQLILMPPEGLLFDMQLQR